MAETLFVEPDLDFIKDIRKFGGADVKKCFQCATCGVACPISPNTKPFPRKEMFAASWGLKKLLIGNGDVWLCHNCGDCSDLCPRGASPGDVLTAVRTLTVAKYAKPRILADAVNNFSKLPLLLSIPVVLFIVIGFLFKIAGINWFNYNPGGDILWQADYINNYFVDMIMVPSFFVSGILFMFSLKNFLFDMHANALQEGKTNREKIEPIDFIKSLISVIPDILTHKKINECNDNKERSTPHMMIFFGFICLLVVTSSFFLAEWVFHIEGPYSQINPIKWIGNVAGVSIVIGGIVLLKNRLAKENQINNYGDWFLIGLVISLGITGLLTEMLRIGNAYTISAIVYFLHLIFVWCLFVYTPYSKLAHILYRFMAMGYQKYSGRE